MKRGFLLMEVVVAVGILVVGLAFVAMQIQNSSRASQRAARSMRTLLLAESTLAEFDAGLIIPDGEETEREYGPLFPDYGWRLLIEPHPNLPDLNQVTLEILHQVRLDIKAEEFDFDEADLVHRLYTLRVTPQPIDLTRDFGMPEEQADELAELLDGVSDRGIDPYNLNPALFAELDLEELIDVAPVLLEAFGMSVSDLMQVLPEELRQALEEAQAEGDTGDTGGSDKAGTEVGEGPEREEREPRRPGRRPRRGGGRKPRNPLGVR